MPTRFDAISNIGRSVVQLHDDVKGRVRPRFFNQVGHETMCASTGNKHFSLNLAIVRLTKIMNRADKNWAQFWEIKYLKNQNFQEHFLIKVGLLVKYSSYNFRKI